MEVAPAYSEQNDPFVQREVALKVALQDGSFRNDDDSERTFFVEARAAGAHYRVPTLPLDDYPALPA